jgi:hypothetical protein
VRLVNFGHFATATCTHNVQAPEHTDAAAFLRTQESQVNQLVFDAVSRYHGSISAEHGGQAASRSIPAWPKTWWRSR